MTRQFRIERRTTSRSLADFDDQRWPIACALAAMAGVVCGVIWAESDFADPRPLYNGWARLAAVAAALVVLVWGSALLEGRVLRRVQLCVLLSLILHLGLVAALHRQFLALAAVRERQQQQDQLDALDVPPVTLPDYSFNAAHEQVTDDLFQQPVATSEFDTNQSLVARQAEIDGSVETPHPPLPDPTAEALQPSPADLRRAEVSAPRQAATAGEELSRQEIEQPTTLTEAIPNEEIRESPAEMPSLEASESTQRQASQLPAPPSIEQTIEQTVEAEPARPQSIDQRPAELPQRPEVDARAAEFDARAAAAADLAAAADRAEELTPAPVETPSAPAQLAPAATDVARPEASSTTPAAKLPAAEEAPRATAPAIESAQRATAAAAPQLPAAAPGPAGAISRQETQPSLPSAAYAAEEVRIAETAGSQNPAPLEAAASGAVLDRQTLGAQTTPASVNPSAPIGIEAERTPAATASGALANRPAIPRRAAAAADAAIPSLDAAIVGSDGAQRPAARQFAGSAADEAASSTAEFPDVGPTPDGAPERPAMAAVSAASQELQPATTGGGRLTAPGGASPLPGALANSSSGSPALPNIDVPNVAASTGVRRDRAPAAGVNDPLARPQSPSLQPTTERFVLERSFGAPTISARITENPIPEFRQRKPEEREKNAAARGATAGSERAVELGLDFLARHQSSDGRWTLDRFDNGRPGYERAGLGQMQSDTAATGLALLAFFGAGYTHLDGRYRLAVAGGLDYLVGNQKEDGDLFTTGSPYVWLYSHGIAAIALCEAYGMTRDPRLREPAQRALDFIIAAQHPTQGGWRYAPQRESDTSVSGWQMMALKSGELSGLAVPRTTYDRLAGWLDHAAAAGAGGARYVYLPASQQTQQRTASVVMTAEALLMRLYLGWDRDDPRLTAGADYLLASPPRYGARNQPTRDAYYWYYATQVMFQVQGARWETWNAQLRELLVNNQVQEGALAGSWDPLGEVPDRWGRQAGRIYVTAMHLLVLEVYYRHLPLYKTLE